MGTDGAGDGKTLTKSQAKNVVALLRRYVADRHNGNRTQAAEALGMSQASISNLLNGKSDPGMKLARAIARVLGASASEVLDGGSDMAVSGRLPLAGLAGWDAAEAEARARHPRLEEWVWQSVRRIAWASDVEATPEFAAEVAYTVLKYARPEAGPPATVSPPPATVSPPPAPAPAPPSSKRPRDVGRRN